MDILEKAKKLKQYLNERCWSCASSSEAEELKKIEEIYSQLIEEVENLTAKSEEKVMRKKAWHEIRGDIIQYVRDNENLTEIEKGPAEELVRKCFQLMSQIIGNLELVRRRAEQKGD